MKKNIFFLLFLFLSAVGGLNLSCSTTEPPIPPDETKPTLTLELDDVSCIEAWLQLKTKDLTLPAELTLKQYNPTGDSLSHYCVLNTQDSLLYIDSLLPNQNYSFQVSHIVAGSTQQQVFSIKQPVTTMDTTSHNFTFQSWTFGTIGSSVLYDVAIINENNIWAVGEIMIADTSQNGYTTYNAVHWNGSEWTLHKLYFYTIPGIADTGVYEARSIFAFDESNIWITSGSQITKWDGIRQTFRHTTPVSINKLWGTDNSNIYAVGYNGQIARFNGTNWQRIESGTTLNINDIWGDFNQKTQEWEILAACGNILHGRENERAIIKISNSNQASLLNSSGAIWPLNGVWFSVNKRYYVNGSGIYHTHNLEENWIGEPLEITQFFIRRIRGNDINDTFGVGDYGETLHFNGLTWKSFINETFLSNGTFLSEDIKNNLIVAVGYQSAQAVLIVGQR
jgi:hypothetical protein